MALEVAFFASTLILGASTPACSASHAAVPTLSAEAPVQTASGSDAAPQTLPPPPAASSPGATGASGCTMARAYQGQVLSQPVFARLVEQDGRVHGRYFYAKVGVDIALAGSLGLDGTVSLVEGEAGAPSGRFAGSCTPRTGVIEGTWTGGHASGPFRLEPIAPRDPPLWAEKRFSIRTRRPDRQSPGAEPRTCSYTETALEFFGIANGDVERRLNHEGVEPSPGPWLAPARADQARTCSEDFEGEMQETVVAAFHGFVTVARGGSGVVVGLAHPLNGSEFEPNKIQSFDLETGLPVGFDKVFARDPIPMVLACAARIGGRAAGPDCSGCQAPSEEEWANVFDSKRFYLTETGIRFVADGFPHVTGVFNGHGPVLPYAVLERDGYLQSDSPVKRAWQAIGPAAASREACPVGHERDWWQ